ncbi:MAG: hypothetical protein ACT4OG_07750 [Alphaproteobacteria bacterium]
MQMGFVGGLTIAGLILLAALTGVVLVKMTTPGQQTAFAGYATSSPATGGAARAAPTPPVITSAPALVLDPITGQSRYARNCNGAVAEAKAIGVLPDYAKAGGDQKRSATAQVTCAATTQSARWDVTFFSRCADGGELCPVLAEVTQEGRHVVFHRE